MCVDAVKNGVNTNMTKITVKDLITQLSQFPKTAQVFVGCDEELNTIYWGFEVAKLKENEDENNNITNKIIIFPLSGQEVEEIF